MRGATCFFAFMAAFSSSYVFAQEVPSNQREVEIRVQVSTDTSGRQEGLPSQPPGTRDFFQTPRRGSPDLYPQGNPEQSPNPYPENTPRQDPDLYPGQTPPVRPDLYPGQAPVPSSGVPGGGQNFPQGQFPSGEPGNFPGTGTFPPNQQPGELPTEGDRNRIPPAQVPPPDATTPFRDPGMSPGSEPGLRFPEEDQGVSPSPEPREPSSSEQLPGIQGPKGPAPENKPRGEIRNGPDGGKHGSVLAQGGGKANASPADYSYERRDAFQKDMRTKLDDFTRRAERLREAADNGPEAMRDAVHRKIDDWEEARQSVKEKTDKLQDVGKEFWDAVKDDVENDVNHLEMYLMELEKGDERDAPGQFRFEAPDGTTGRKWSPSGGSRGIP